MAEMDLGKKVGPLPLGGWVLVVGAGLTVGFLINKNAAKKADNAPVQLAESGTGAGGGSFLPISPPSTSTGDAPAVEDNNQAWGLRGVKWLIAQGNDPSVADNAIRKYLYGESLSLAERIMIDSVLVKYGPPPEPLPPVDVTPIPPIGGTGAKPGPVTGLVVSYKSATSVTLAWNPVAGAARYIIRTEEPAGVTSRIPDRSSMDTQHTIAPLGFNIGYRFYVRAQNNAGDGPEATVAVQTDPMGGLPGQARTYVVRAGDTLSSIANTFYGNGSVVMVQRLYAANVGALEAAARDNGKANSQNGFLLFPGTALHIP